LPYAELVTLREVVDEYGIDRALLAEFEARAKDGAFGTPNFDATDLIIELMDCS
jgi:hypothetical protein